MSSFLELLFYIQFNCECTIVFKYLMGYNTMNKLIFYYNIRMNIMSNSNNEHCYSIITNIVFLYWNINNTLLYKWK